MAAAAAAPRRGANRLSATYQSDPLLPPSPVHLPHLDTVVCVCRRINVAGKKFVVGRQQKKTTTKKNKRKEKLREKKIEILFCDLWQCVAEPGDLL